MDLLELRETISLLNKSNSRKGIIVSVADTETGLLQTFRSKKEAAREMKADETTFYNNRPRLFRNKYEITIIDTNRIGE